MAIYHLTIKTISRANGRCATAAAAYRAGVQILDSRLGQNFDYRKKTGVISKCILLPKNARGWAPDRAQLWNAAEAAETRKNSTVGREFEVALPAELNSTDRQNLAEKLAGELCERHQIGVDLAVHAPGRAGDNRNHHAHILCTTRRITNSGFGEKSRELDDKKSGEVEYWRERWGQLVNEALQAANLPDRVDHRSHSDRGISEEPTTHCGPAKTALARRLRGPHKAQNEAPRLLTPAQIQAAGRLETMRARLLKSSVQNQAQAQEVTLNSKNEITKNANQATHYTPF